MTDIFWLYNLKAEVSEFMKRVKGTKRRGFFHYSLTGDLFGEDVKWGLGNCVFAVKIFHTLNLLDSLPKEQRDDISNFIQCFRVEPGFIFDPLVKKRASCREKLAAIKNLYFKNYFHKQTIIAETRQSVSALKLLGQKSPTNFTCFPKTCEQIDSDLGSLNWNKPWAAGSHFSHLLFFLNENDSPVSRNLIDRSISYIDGLQNPVDGAWYRGDPTLRQKINGAMKVITGFNAIGHSKLSYSKTLIDLCLSATNDEHACDNFNIIYVLNFASKFEGYSYRIGEIRQFALNRLKKYRDHYFADIGGFSFWPNQANVYYYDAKLTRGLREPDIHGTCLFLWGISHISQILQIEKELDFNELIS